MFKRNGLFKKIALGALILGIGLAALPVTAASAASLPDTSTPPSTLPGTTRLEQAWAREQRVYQREGDLLSKAQTLVDKVQALIDKAKDKGWDTSAVQSALDAFEAVLPAAQAAHAKGQPIIDTHAGFDASGKVTDPTTALETVKALRQVLQDTRTAMDGTGKALRKALKAFRDAHKPAKPVNP